MNFSPVTPGQTYQKRTNQEILDKNHIDTQQCKEKLKNDTKLVVEIQKNTQLAPEKVVEISPPNSKILQLQYDKEDLVSDPVGVELLAGTGKNGSRSEEEGQVKSDSQNMNHDSDGCDDCCCDDIDCSGC